MNYSKDMFNSCADLGTIPSELDNGLASQAAVGLVVLASDQSIEREFGQLLSLPGLGLYCSRLFNDNQISEETLRAIGPRIGASVDLILPGMALDVVAFGCTSATMVLGEDYVFSEVRKVRPRAKCTTPITAARAAFAALGAQRIGMLTPYAPPVNARMVGYFRDHGIGVVAAATFDRPDDREAARISANSIARAATLLATRANLDAIFVSCTSLRVAHAINAIESDLDLPITSSNHAMAWHSLRLAGLEDAPASSGQLFRQQLGS